MEVSDSVKPLSCCLCDGYTEVPLLLKCFHSICETCAEAYRAITCPTCQEVTPFESLTVNNFFMIAQRASRITSGQETCETCPEKNEKNKADWWCEGCSQALCDECLQLHNEEFDTHELGEASEPTEDTEELDEYQGDCSFHMISSLVGAVENKRSTVWHIQRRCKDHGKMSFNFCLHCRAMKCNDCLTDCTHMGHKTCATKDEQAAEFSEASFNQARSDLDYLAYLSTQQHFVMGLRLVEARNACKASLVRKREVMFEAIRKAYSDAVDQLDNEFEAIIRKDFSSAKLHATCVQQAVLYGELLLQHSQINAGRRQWQLLMPRIKILTDTEQQLLQKYWTVTLPVIDDTVSTSKLEELCQEWFGGNAQPTGDDDQPPSDKKDKENECEAVRVQQSSDVQLAVVTTESLMSDNGEPAGEPPDSEMTRLIAIVTSEMNKISETCGPFAYYFGRNMEVEAYVTSDNKGATDALQEELRKISEQYVPVTFKVKQDAPVALFCCGGVGSLLTVGRMEQVVGLYLQYKAKGIIYWVSAAHGLVKCSPESLQPNKQVHFIEAAKTTSFIHVSNQPKITARFSACPDLDMVDIPVPYVALSYNPLALRNQTFLCHSVDIMMGPTPLTNWHVSNYMPCKSSLISAINGCCQPLCWARHHARGSPLYTISGIKYFEPVSGAGCTIFKMHDLVGKPLRCYLGDERQLAIGEVHSVYNRTPTKMHGSTPATIDDHASASVYLAQNMIRIRPTGSCRPAEGHSGSVWVWECAGSGRYEAVAITCAVIVPREQNSTLEPDEHESWLAAPLCACLQALSEEYPERFADYKEFTVLN